VRPCARCGGPVLWDAADHESVCAHCGLRTCSREDRTLDVLADAVSLQRVKDRAYWERARRKVVPIRRR